MFTLLGSLIGFIGSAVPEIIKLFRDRQNNKQELAIMDRQVEITKLNHTQRLAEVNTQADVIESQALYRHDASLSSGFKWVEALRASVRPILTYAFFIVFAVVKGSALYLMIHDHNIDWTSALIQIWDVETSSIFSCIVSFWFSQRALAKLRGGG